MSSSCFPMSWRTALCLVGLGIVGGMPNAIAQDEGIEATVRVGQPIVAMATSTVNFEDMRDSPALKRPDGAWGPFRPIPRDEPIGAPKEGAPPPTYSKGLGDTLPPLPDVTFQALPDGGAIPPDTHGAVGEGHLFVTLNDRVRVQSRAGASESTTSLPGFWSSLGVTDAFDPKSVYDPATGRYYFACLAQKRSAANSMLIGVSATADPAGPWYLSRFDVDPLNIVWADFTYIGFSADKIVLTTNLFALVGDVFQGSRAYVFDKSAALSAPLAAGATLDLGARIAYAPSIGHDPGETTCYLVRVFSSFSGTLEFATITGTGLAPTLNTFVQHPQSAGWNNNLPNANQLGSLIKVETNDDRIQSVVLRNGVVWCVHHIGLPKPPFVATAAGFKWWRVDPASVTAIESGDVADDGGNTHYYYPSIAVNASDQALIGFTLSSIVQYPSAGYLLLDRSDGESGLPTQPATFRAGDSFYVPLRWGDYSATVVDPVDDHAFWTVQMYASATNSWGTTWANVVPEAPPEPPAPPALSSGGSLAGIVASVLIVVSLGVVMIGRYLTDRRNPWNHQ